MAVSEKFHRQMNLHLSSPDISCEFTWFASMATLLRLPNEILLRICQTFCSHCQATNLLDNDDDDHFDSLLALTETCKSLHDVANPLLLHSVSSFGDPRVFWDKAAQDHDFAKQVKHFDGTSWTDHECWSESDSADESRLKAAAERMGLQWFPTTPDMTREDVPDDILNHQSLMAVLSLLPSVEKVKATAVGGPTEFPNAWNTSSTVTKSVFPLLTGLQHLTIQHWDTEGGFRLGSFAVLLGMAPNLQRLSLNQFLHCVPDLPLSSVCELDFGESAPSIEDMRNLIDACGPLTRMDYASGGATVSQYGEDDEIRLAELIDLLRMKSTTSLRELKIDLLNAFEDDRDDDLMIRDLKDFESLEVLEIFSEEEGDWLVVDEEESTSDQIIFLDRMLPGSLRSLAIRSTSEEMTAALVRGLLRLAPKVKRSHPHLRLVRILDPSRVTEYQPCEDAFQNTGVELSFRYDEYN